MIKITVIGDKTYEFEPGITLEEVARRTRQKPEPMALLAYTDGKLRELTYAMERDYEVRFVTLADQAGYMTYKRSIMFLFLKACEDVLGKGIATKITNDYSIGNGSFCQFSDPDLVADDEMAAKIQHRMEELFEANLPIVKKSIDTHQARKDFEEVGLKEKQKLFRFRRDSNTNIYMLDGYWNYLYGYMVPSTKYINAFLVSAFEGGFVIQTPKRYQTETIARFVPQPKLFRVMRRSRSWSKTMGVDTVGALNEVITQGDVRHLILLQEGLQEKLLSDIADEIIHANKRMVLIAGPSSSGKTTFSHRLSIQLEIGGKRPHPIALDDYFKDREQSPKDEDGNYNFETIASLDVDLFMDHMNRLLNGEKIEMPTYNFITGKREYNGRTMQIGSDDILVIEGIHGLNEQLSSQVPNESKYKIYVSALSQINIDEHNRIPSTDGRLLRRIVRDYSHRGNDAKATIAAWDSVRKGEEQNIFPYQEEADVMFNSAQIYELAVLKQYAEPLLFAVPKDCPEYQEAKRLLNFLDYFLNIKCEDIPQTSLLREFIGGSCFET